QHSDRGAGVSPVTQGVSPSVVSPGDDLRGRDAPVTSETPAPLLIKRIAGLRIEALPPQNSEKPDPLHAGFALSHVSAMLVSPATNRLAARYVRLELPGSDRILSLAEVQVFNGRKNIALEGEATQSSTAYEGAARLAIDGQTDGDFDKKSTTHTERSENPWWELD